MEERKSKYEFINIFEMVKLMINRLNAKYLISSEDKLLILLILYIIAHIFIMFPRKYKKKEPSV